MFRYLLLITMLLGMAFAGFWQSEKTALTPPLWTQSGGLEFNARSFAYDPQFKVSPLRVDSTREYDTLCIELTLQPYRFNRASVSVILDIQQAQNQQRIVIGQWQQSLMILNGDDFNNRRKEPKIYLRLPDAEKTIRLDIRSNDQGTWVYLDGHLSGKSHDLYLNLLASKPALESKSDNYFLVLGSALNGRNNWHGRIDRLEIYGAVSAAHTAELTEIPRENRLVLAEYDFMADSAMAVKDKSSFRHQLLFSSEHTVLMPDTLKFPALSEFSYAWMWRDILINLLGFIPLGMLLGHIIARKAEYNFAAQWVICLILTGCFSLFIELIQVYLPGRNSSLLDLILNTAGGGVGGWLTLMLRHRQTK